MLHDYILEFFNWHKNEPKNKTNALNSSLQCKLTQSSSKVFQGQHCHSFRFSQAHTNKTPNLGLFTSEHAHEAAASVFVFTCFLHSLKMPLFAPHLLMGAYGSIKVSAHHEAWTFWGDKEVRKANNSKVIKSPHRDIKLNLAGHGRQRTSEGHRQVNGRHRFA